MGRPRLDDIRKKELIDAAIEMISTYGVANATINRISSAAGVRPGMVHHYFDSKDQLCEAAMRSLLFKLHSAVLSRLRESEDPNERIRAVIDGNFAPDQFTKEGIRAWIAFWERVPKSPAMARLQRINARRTRSNLLHDLKKLMPEAEARDATANLTALMDGLWLRCAMARDDFLPDEARRLALQFLHATVAAHGRKSKSKRRAKHTVDKAKVPAR